MTTGALQTLVRTQRVCPGERVLIAGNGPLNLQLACELLAAGVRPVAVVEAAAAPGLAAWRTGWRMLRAAPDLAREGMGMIVAAAAGRRADPVGCADHRAGRRRPRAAAPDRRPGDRGGRRRHQSRLSAGGGAGARAWPVASLRRSRHRPPGDGYGRRRPLYCVGIAASGDVCGGGRRRAWGGARGDGPGAIGGSCGGARSRVCRAR